MKRGRVLWGAAILGVMLGSVAARGDDREALLLQKLAEHHGHLNLSLTLDEKCHLMTGPDRQTISSEREEVLKNIGGIKDINARAKVLAQSRAFEDQALKTTPCGPKAQAVVAETLQVAKKFQAARQSDKDPKSDVNQWLRFVKVSAINEKCQFFEARATTLLTDQASQFQAKALAGYPSEAAKAEALRQA